MGYSSIQTHTTEAIPSFFDSIHQSSSSLKCFLQMSTMTHCAQAFTCFVADLNRALPCSQWQTNPTTPCNLTASNRDTNSQSVLYPLHSLPCSPQLTSNSFRPPPRPWPPLCTTPSQCYGSTPLCSAALSTPTIFPQLKKSSGNTVWTWHHRTPQCSVPTA